VPVEDRQYLGQRHATSKISNFEEIDSVRTYGFRGEAIASLCIIGDVSVTTCVGGETTAKMMEFDTAGSLTSYSLFETNGREKVVPGQRGTTVVARNLFRALPVRLAQARKQRISVGKMKSLLMNYALVRRIRFAMQLRGKRKLDWTIPSDSNALAVATSVFGKESTAMHMAKSWSGSGVTIDGVLPAINEGFPR
jgi:DNA mismatch repair ATPase MutL